MRKLALLVLVACSPKQEAPPPLPPADAAIDAPPGITTIPTFDPTSGMHLDDDVGVGSGHVAPRPTTRRPGRPIEVTLRSTPPNATASVDGQPLGTTPAFWQGEANGREHEFTFTLRGHATARYRFVPVQSGVVHARLERTGDDTTPLPPPPPPAPIIAPDAAPAPRPLPPPPPPTVLSVDAAEAPPVDAPAPVDAAPPPAD